MSKSGLITLGSGEGLFQHATGVGLCTPLGDDPAAVLAHAEGLGACVLTAPLLAEPALAGHVPPPRGYQFTCAVALGWPAEHPDPPARKPVLAILEWRGDDD